VISDILRKFVEKSPVTLTVRVLLEYLLDADKLDRWFETVRRKQYTRDILFSSLVGLMLQVVCRTRANVYEAYRHAGIAASIVAVYDKLKGIEPTTSQGLVREVARDAATLIETLQGAHSPLLPGYRTKYLDGNCLAASERRLKPLRESAAGALPGKSLVVFDRRLGIVCDVFPCPDGHAQERALLPQVGETVATGDLWIADRNFCVRAFLCAIRRQGAFFVIRQHANLATKPLSPMRFVGRSPSGEVYEQPVELADADGRPWQLRRVIVKLHKATRNGDATLNILANLPPEAADAPAVAALYRTRWTIETAFQKLEKHLNSEIRALGYPQAALFGFCLALVAFNLYAVQMAALRAAHPAVDIDADISEYYLAGEIAATFTGMSVALSDVAWGSLAHASPDRVCILLLDLAKRVDLKIYLKTTRGPKKPPVPPTKYKGRPHVSTAKLLAGT
jgi:hypothetical protein